MTVHGAHFSAASEALGLLLCRMGGVVRRAVWASSRRSCATRRVRMAGEVRVEVSNNGREYTSTACVCGWCRACAGGAAVERSAGGATVVSVRGRGLMPGGCGAASASRRRVAGWGGGASRLRCAAPPSAA